MKPREWKPCYATDPSVRSDHLREVAVKGWQQIETAPDDACVLTSTFAGCQCVAYKPSGHRDWETVPQSDYKTTPTHWQPLPAPPEQQPQAERDAERHAEIAQDLAEFPCSDGAAVVL